MRSFWILLSFFFITGNLACNNTATGTRVGNPISTQVAPEIESIITEVALGSQISTSQINREYNILGIRSALAQTLVTPLNEPASLWTEIFLEGEVNDARNNRVNITSFLQVVASALDEAGITEAAQITTPVTITLGQTTLIDTTSTWEITIQPDTTQTGSIRMYIKNLTTNFYQATYLFEPSETSLATTRAIFTYVNPETLADTASSGHRVFGITFDFRTTATSYLAMMSDHFNSNTGNFATYKILHQCNPSTTQCVGQYMEISATEPSREFAHLLRYGWNDTDLSVGITSISYDSSTEALGTTQCFTGPTQPDSLTITEGSCTILSPVWSGHVFREAELVSRYKDTTPHGGDAAEFYGDGTTTSTWDSVNFSLIGNF